MITLPFPPSVNSYWRHVMVGKHPRTLISEKGRLYRKNVIDECLVANVTNNLKGHLVCTLELYPPCNRRRDCDNHAKAVLDAMTHAKVYADDSQIIDLRIRMLPKQPPGKVVVTLREISEVERAGLQADLLAEAGA
jgi:crossover junction endodeoxyribonuclease RusA